LHKDGVAAVMAARRNRPLFLIDIAVPRDIDADVQELENVYLYNVDHLEAIVRENVRMREQELAQCQTIIADRAAELMPKLAPRPEPFARRPASWSNGLEMSGAFAHAASPNFAV
jgi:glutamyl-tRNA reductase